MIKNEREYRIVKAHAAKLEHALEELTTRPRDQTLHPLLAKAQREALESQVQELKEELNEYETLQQGETSVIEVDSFDGLPKALIKARIAAGLTQRDLAERIGLKEQQIQRYEATEYASASLSRINAVVQTLGLRVHKSVLLPIANASVAGMFERLRNVGIERDFVLSRLASRELAARLEDQTGSHRQDSKLALQLASTVGRVYGWNRDELLGPNPLVFRQQPLNEARFKLPARADAIRLQAYTGYAYYLARVGLMVSSHLTPRPIPMDARAVEAEIRRSYGAVTLEHALRYVWSLGIAVLPLSDSGTFHGAFWRLEGRNVIVLKQRTPSVARWINDLLHELWHAAQEPELLQRTVVETGESPIERRGSEEEEAATLFASEVILQGRAEELTQLCVREARGAVERLKTVVPRVAVREKSNVDALANYIAFRLSGQDINWWGTATSLQSAGPNPWQIARDVFFECANLGALEEPDRTLLERALGDPEV